jgi:hypothetical protein
MKLPWAFSSQHFFLANATFRFVRQIGALFQDGDSRLFLQSCRADCRRYCKGQHRT